MACPFKVALLRPYLGLSSVERELVLRYLEGLHIAHLPIIVTVADRCESWLAGVREFDRAAHAATGGHDDRCQRTTNFKGARCVAISFGILARDFRTPSRPYISIAANP